jgi:hypothetical protein
MAKRQPSEIPIAADRRCDWPWRRANIICSGRGSAANQENTMTERVTKSRPGSRPTASQGVIMIASVSGAAQAPTIITSGQPYPLR